MSGLLEHFCKLLYKGIPSITFCPFIGTVEERGSEIGRPSAELDDVPPSGMSWNRITGGSVDFAIFCHILPVSLFCHVVSMSLSRDPMSKP